MIAERLTFLITIEQGRKNFERQSGGHEQRTLFQRCQNRVAEFPRVFVVFGELQVIFSARGLMTGGYAAINPIILLEQLATTGDLFGT
jgi:hypothetical protein